MGMTFLVKMMQYNNMLCNSSINMPSTEI